MTSVSRHSPLHGTQTEREENVVKWRRQIAEASGGRIHAKIIDSLCFRSKLDGHVKKLFIYQPGLEEYPFESIRECVVSIFAYRSL